MQVGSPPLLAFPFLSCLAKAVRGGVWLCDCCYCHMCTVYIAGGHVGWVRSPSFHVRLRSFDSIRSSPVRYWLFPPPPKLKHFGRPWRRECTAALLSSSVPSAPCLPLASLISLWVSVDVMPCLKSPVMPGYKFSRTFCCWSVPSLRISVR